MATIPVNITESPQELYPRLIGELQLRHIYEIHVNSALFSQHGIGGSDFKPTEILAKELLQTADIVPRAATIRHGDDMANESDIIVNEKYQIEVVTAMGDFGNLDNKILPFLPHEKNFLSSHAVDAKFVCKNKIYTDNFRKCLFILFTGDNVTSIELAEDIKSKIQGRGVVSDNFFETVYIARYDLMLRGYDVLAVNVNDTMKDNRIIVYNDTNIRPLIVKKAVKIDKLKDEEFYFVDVNIETNRYLPPLVVRGEDVVDALRKYLIS